MEYVIRFAISLFDLAVFMYYFHSNKKMKPVSKVWILAGFTIAAIIWTFVSSIKNPYLNLATLLIVLILLSFYYISGMWTRIINIVTFMGIGMLFEPVALLLLHAMNFHMGESYKYYFVMVICSFVRGNVMYILSKLISKKGMQIADFPKEILGIVYFEKKGRQAVIHTISENFKANMTTEEIWKQLDDKVFAHIHVSYIINLGHIRAIEGDEVVMDNEERLLIARSHKQNLKEKHMEFVRRMV